MQKVRKKLLKEQKERGVIFASTLSAFRTEQPDDHTHEILATDEGQDETMDRLLDDKFFNNSPFHNFNIIRTI
jgi:hypothetical protein|tara:strand:- start:65 stop:283 length:219 start_codon:yes stop_codon:yes gene_type:complete